MNDSRLGTLIDTLEAQAWHDSYCAAPPDWRARVGMRNAIVGRGFALAARHYPHGLLNRVRLLTGDSPVQTADIDAALDWLHRHAEVPYTVDLRAAAGSAPWALLEAAGLSLSGRVAKFSRTAAAEIATVDCAFELREVHPASAADFARVAQASFDLAPGLQPWLQALPGRRDWRCFAAYEGGRAVAAGAMFVQGTSAWLGWGCTLPDYRRRGAQAALLARRLQEGRAAGVRLFTIETGYPVLGDQTGTSCRNVERLGFDLRHLRQVFRKDVAAAASPGTTTAGHRSA